MKKTSLRLGLLGVVALAALTTNPAHAQSLRAWVSSSGTDANACTRAAPCATFQGAHDKVATGGEINCVDAGTYSNITINKTVTIDCAGTTAIISHNGETGITVAAGTTSRVILRNISLNGFIQGGVGIQYNGGAELELENVTLSGGDPNFPAMVVAKPSSGVLSIRNSNFSKRGIGIRMQTTSGNLVVSVSNTSFNNLTSTGIEVGANTFVSVNNSVFSSMNGYGIAAATATSTVYAMDNVFSNNNIGIGALAAGAKVNATGNRLFGSSRAFNIAAGATFLSGGDNKIDINPGSTPAGALTDR